MITSDQLRNIPARVADSVPIDRLRSLDASEIVHRVEDQIRRRPAASLAVGALAGVIVGWLLKRK